MIQLALCGKELRVGIATKNGRFLGAKLTSVDGGFNEPIEKRIAHLVKYSDVHALGLYPDEVEDFVKFVHVLKGLPDGKACQFYDWIVEGHVLLDPSLLLNLLEK